MEIKLPKFTRVGIGKRNTKKVSFPQQEFLKAKKNFGFVREISKLDGAKKFHWWLKSKFLLHQVT